MIKGTLSPIRCPIKRGYGLRYVLRDQNFEAIINRILQLLFAPDVSLRRLDGSVPEQKTNLFKFAVAIVAESGTGTTKIVWRQIRDASLSRTPLDRIPDHVGRHASFLSFPLLRNPSEHPALAHARMHEPCIQKLLGP